MIDDSVVRGTVLKEKIRALLRAGAKEVHVRVGYPILTDICLLNVSTKTREELAFYKYGDSEGILRHLGATSLRYTPIEVSIECLIEGTNLTKEDFCLFCANSESPIRGF